MNASPDQSVAIVTGSSSGIGFETSLTLARNGFYTYATVRKLEGGSIPITDIARKKIFHYKLLNLMLIMNNQLEMESIEYPRKKGELMLLLTMQDML